ncbi:MAG: hypothetical protein R2692_06345 [Microbacterium sp.]
MIALPVGSRVAQFAQDFTTLSGTPWEYEVCGERTIRLRLGDAMEFLETVLVHATGCRRCTSGSAPCPGPTGRNSCASVGLEIDERSGPWRNIWLVENRFAPAASLTDLEGAPLPWPDTHVLLAARRPLDA